MTDLLCSRFSLRSACPGVPGRPTVTLPGLGAGSIGRGRRLERAGSGSGRGGSPVWSHQSSILKRSMVEVSVVDVW